MSLIFTIPRKQIKVDSIPNGFECFIFIWKSDYLEVWKEVKCH